MRTLRAGKLKREQPGRRRFIKRVAGVAAHQCVIAGGKKSEQVSQVAAAFIAQPPDVLDRGKRILRTASNAQQFLSRHAAKKRAGDLGFHHSSHGLCVEHQFI
jgi:hypothetical protein